MPYFPSRNFLPTVIVSAVTSAFVFVLLIVTQPFLRPSVASLLGSPATSTGAVSLRVPTTPLAPTVLGEDEAVVKLVKNAQPAVVAILVLSSTSRPAPPQIEFFPFSFPQEPLAPPKKGGKKPEPQQVGGGSGFFVSEDGILVTNRHVTDFENAEFQVLTYDGKKHPATLMGTDPLLDIAFLKVDGGRFPYLTFGDSDALQPGQTVIAIGNALDQFRNTVTKGVVSGLNRRIFAGDGETTELLEEAIQTDAAINPGNSGGPLLDLQGRVVGLNTAVSDQGQLLGFALPSNTVKRDAEAIRKTGKIVRPFLGVRYQMITEELVKKNQLTIDHGALIVRGTERDELAVSPGSPADIAGLVENDIILEVDDQPVNEEHSLSALIGRHAPGDIIRLKILHGGVEKTVRATLVELK